MNTVSLTEVKETLGEDVFKWIKQSQKHVTDETRVHIVDDEGRLPRPNPNAMYRFDKNDGSHVLVGHSWGGVDRLSTAAYIEDEDLLLIWPG